MTVHTPTDIASMAILHGLDDAAAAKATAICLAESGGDDEAIGDIALQDGTWGPSIGMPQIRTLKNPKSSDPWYRVRKNIEHNEQAQMTGMVQISGNGQNWKAWTTFTTGTYLVYMPQATKAVAEARAGGAQKDNADAGEVNGEIIPGVSEDPLTAIKSLTSQVSSIGDAVGSIGKLFSIVSSPEFAMRAVKIGGGGAIVITSLLVLNRSLVTGAVSNVAKIVK